ncbi:hypothetical protein D3OALGA1CA_278 [Olavius algarvensis associated proteobacterium Delta 3]|nr:hypothetical protein D3OALGA1CA_278 [Olavius algarvensis associated proteobacterium Delta 3]
MGRGWFSHNKSLHWIFILLCSVKTSEFNRYVHEEKWNETLQ